LRAEDFDWSGEVFADGLRIQDRQNDGDPAHHELYSVPLPADLTELVHAPNGFKHAGLHLVRACREGDHKLASILSMVQSAWAAERGEDELAHALETMSALYSLQGIPEDKG